MTIRALRKGCLAGLAGCLGLLAVLLLLLRLVAWQADTFTPRLEALLQTHLGAPVSIESLSVDIERDGLSLSLTGVTAELPDKPLFSLGRLDLSLDLWSSLRAAAPVFSQARMDAFKLHLYRGDGMAWRWPSPAILPFHLDPDTRIDMGVVDAWTQLILRQRLWVTDTRVLMHGNDSDATLHAPELVLGGDETRIRLAGTVAMASSLSPRQPDELPAARVRADVRPGDNGLQDFSAALQLDMQLEQLSALAELVRPAYVPRLALTGGRSRLWGRWQSGRLEDVRLKLNMPEVALSQADDKTVLKELHARGQWRRRGDGGEAWLSGDAADVERTTPSRHQAPTLPKRWQFTHHPRDWQLRTSNFELDSLLAWGDYLVLPDSLKRPLQSLAPRGRVTGLQVGRQDGEWRVDAALRDLAVSPWDEAPGGGPLDAWIQARDQRGRVAFSGDDDSTLAFPEVFTDTMQLDSAQGEVQWVYDGQDTLISGRKLQAEWKGAAVQGEFGLLTGDSQQQLGLDLDFRNVDAVNNPLVDWLPMKVLDDDLRQWLNSGISGEVEQGRLQITAPLGERATPDHIKTTLALDVTRGSLPIAPGWPTITGLEGRLQLDQGRLDASLSQARSLGVRADHGEVALDVASGKLDVSGRLKADAEALKAFLLAAPVLSEEQKPALENIQAQGDVLAELELTLPLDDPEALSLDIDTSPRLEQLAYAPLDADMQELTADLTWQQRGSRGTLNGEARGTFLGGDIRADFTPGEVALDGRADMTRLLGVAGIDLTAAAQAVSGVTPWQGTLALGASPTLTLQSQLNGVSVDLPAPFAKSPEASWPWTLDADLGAGRVESSLSDVALFRGRLMGERLAGHLILGTEAVQMPPWPDQHGWQIDAGARRIAPLEWQSLGDVLSGAGSAGQSSGSGAGQRRDPPLELTLQTPCLMYRGECLGRALASGQRRANGSLDLTLDGTLLTGRLRYRPGAVHPLDIDVGQLVADRLPEMAALTDDTDADTQRPPEAMSETAPKNTPENTPETDRWMKAVETRAEKPAGMPAWLASLPDGRLRVAEIVLDDKRLGPLTAYWQAGPRQFTLSPVGLTLGELSARGELVWQGNTATSDTRAQLTLAGGDVGTALARLDQPVAMRSDSTRVSASLRWPGAPWQFDLNRATGDVATEVHNGRFVTLESTPARLVGLLNFDNILRRLRLDFSDVTGEGTAFNRIEGKADVAGGILRLRGPLIIDAPSTGLRLTGRVNLLQRELDQRLGVTLPVSQSLPIAALAAGAPVVGGALFVAHTLFGNALERATTIHYRLEGPWASPDITLEGSQ
ncbi:YhdP family phospholipid transporter [Vreelandella jeotgali]|uniref:YhdP family phospholipid transporter n=1 Tax=Vreelandella jeotgali TaxID=553386 RepID=UPI00034C9831|nr:AsmA-like C-terminal region-containing protein [Halomonas jeotgali]